TVLAIANELTKDGFVLRYRVDETDDGLTGEEGTFTICSIWLVSALAEIGEFERACELCEKLLAHSSRLGLFAEELDPRSGRHLGQKPELKVDRRRSDRHGLRRDVGRVLRRAKDIHDVDGLRNILEPRVGLLPQDHPSVGIDGDDAEPGGLHRARDGVRGLSG